MLSEQSQTQPKAVSIFTAKTELHVSWEEPCPTVPAGILIVRLRTKAPTGKGFSFGNDPPSVGPSGERPRARVPLPALSTAAARPITCGGDTMTVVGHKNPKGAK